MIRTDPFEVLTTPPPAVPADEALRLLREHWGLTGELTGLTSERDQNFRVTTPNGSRYVLKIANSSEDPAITDFQNAVLVHLHGCDLEIPLPRLVPGIDGRGFVVECIAPDGRRHRVRLLTWLEGTPLQQAGSASAAALGACLARLGRALADFEHPASDYALLWDLKHAAALRSLLQHVGDPDLRELCGRRLDIFESRLQPNLDTVRWQVIYNDLNPSNVLIDPLDPGRITGVIDFGDMVRSPLIVDVAVAAAYLLREEGDALADVLEFVAAYGAIVPLEVPELELLFDLILTRSITTVLITHWRASRYPENRAYILRNEPRARNMLARLGKLGASAATDRLREACD